MALDQSKIVSNTKKYFDTARKNGFMNDELMRFLGEDFIKAPATNMADFHNAFEGGLIDHLLRVANYAIRINNSLPDDEKVDQKSLLTVCLLHGIGKAKMFTPCTSEWHRKNQGKMYEYNNDLASMTFTERSVYYILSHGIQLSEEEYVAIISLDKKDDMVKYHNSMLGELLKMGNTLAIKHTEKNAE